jgi:hypothetical protein
MLRCLRAKFCGAALYVTSVRSRLEDETDRGVEPPDCHKAGTTSPSLTFLGLPALPLPPALAVPPDRADPVPSPTPTTAAAI